jgi:hypothetical protein
LLIADANKPDSAQVFEGLFKICALYFFRTMLNEEFFCLVQFSDGRCDDNWAAAISMNDRFIAIVNQANSFQSRLIVLKYNGVTTIEQLPTLAPSVVNPRNLAFLLRSLFRELLFHESKCCLFVELMTFDSNVVLGLSGDNTNLFVSAQYLGSVFTAPSLIALFLSLKSRLSCSLY